MAFLLVGLGGSIGALLRYQISRWIDMRGFWLSFPTATLIVNITGAFLLGWLTNSIAGLFPSLGSAPMLFLGTGVCGAYTTFSTFTYEALMLFQEGRVLAGITYMSLSFLLGTAAAAVGLFGFK
ncbi:fluoride efflux transporter CrcB [Alicyclobacillus sp. SO9]|uniref:fluoride efflux transporter CrcB n=1 Tax=Alicyclobacillus sp. SO9 TaxID=2665646 RepID=UPI0018E8085E|nr:fluoride efflux transporter CrcB [Alicyclobacillus sp. SO9]QQE77371.1 fluoride efflux transporter CrcB [Alicyclobacillus sp. SO9]